MLHDYESICAAVARIKKRYGKDRDPFRLCDHLGFRLNPRDLGRGPNAIKALIVECSRIKCITFNTNLPDELLGPTIFHECGHGVLHPIGLFGYTDITLYDESSRKEKEANLFCAEYMLEDDEVLEALNADLTFFDAARALYVPAELLDFKFRLLKWKGYKLGESPIYARANFLGDALPAPGKRS